MGVGRCTRKEGGLAERLLGIGADVARGVERGRQAVHQPPLVAVGRAPSRHRNRRDRLGLKLGAELSTSTLPPLGFEMGSRARGEVVVARGSGGIWGV